VEESLRIEKLNTLAYQNILDPTVSEPRLDVETPVRIFAFVSPGGYFILGQL
jgi:hypothetical protein